MAFTSNVVTAVQSRLAPMSLGQLTTILGSMDILGGQVVNSAGVVTIGGRGLTNQQYEMIYEMIGGQLNT